MILKVENMSGLKKVVSDSPTAEMTAETIATTDWNKFSFVTLFWDDANYLDGSGCVGSGDGLSISHSKNGIQFISERAPESPQEMVPYFEAYLSGDMDTLYGLLYDAENRGLSKEQVEKLRLDDEMKQR